MKNINLALSAYCLCETLAGDFAYTLGRVAFKPGRPMLVEHIDGLYLEHDLTGNVITPGYDNYRIIHLIQDNAPQEDW